MSPLKIKYDSSLMGLMSTFMSATGVQAKDCLVDDAGILVFIVNTNELGRAVGKGGFKVRQLERAFNRKIKIVEFNPEPVTFVENLVFPAKIKSANMEGKIITIESVDSFNRGHLIGRGGQNLRNFEKIVQRHFDIEEIKVK